MFEQLRKTTICQFIEQLALRYKNDDLASMSAQITYYLILAFFPFLFFLINLLSFTHLSERLLISNFSLILPNEAALLVKNILLQAMQTKSTLILLLGMIGSLWAASQGMLAIIRGLNHSYGVKENRKFLKLNFIALLSTLGLTVMIIFSFFMIAFGRNMGFYLFGLMGAKPLFHSIWSLLRYIVSLVLMFTTFYLIYRYLPNRKLKSNNVIKGTVFTTFSWVFASLLFSFYINNFANFELFYSGLGGIFALIIWLYISTLIFLLGGEINAISSKREN